MPSAVEIGFHFTYDDLEVAVLPGQPVHAGKAGEHLLIDPVP